jgi:hypothetical protein
MGYEDSVYLAKLAEQAERYEGETNSWRLLFAVLPRAISMSNGVWFAEGGGVLKKKWSRT